MEKEILNNQAVIMEALINLIEASPQKNIFFPVTRNKLIERCAKTEKLLTKNKS